MTGQRLPALGSLILLITACTSAPVHFHTLVPAPEAANGGPPSSVASGVIVEAVKIPAQVDRIEMVVRQNNGEIAVLNNELWIAPLPDELQSALSGDIHRQLRIAAAMGAPVPQEISIRVVVERFESAPSHYALIDASWEIRANTSTQKIRLWCASHAYEPVGDGYVALERGHQRAVALISDQIATAVKGLKTENASACPLT